MRPAPKRKPDAEEREATDREAEAEEGVSAASPAKRRKVEEPSAKTAAKDDQGSEIVEGEGVRFSVDGKNWHDGYCTEIEGGAYTVFIADKIIKDHYGYSSLHLRKNQLKSDSKIRARLGRKKTKSSKRDWSAAKLATREQQREVTGLHSSIAPLLLRHPVHFGQLLRTGGHVGSEEFQNVAKSLGIKVALKIATKGKSKNKQTPNAVVANDTSAILATKLDDLEKGPGEWLIHGKSPQSEEPAVAEKTPGKRSIGAASKAPAKKARGSKQNAAKEESIEPVESETQCPVLTESELRKLKDFDLAAFKEKFVFQQGSHSGEKLKLPEGDKRRSLHAEAKAVRSPSWDHILQQTIAQFRRPKGATSLPSRRKIISIAINRSSCGTKKGSGHTGGCAGELSVVIAEFWAALSKALGPKYVADLRATGRIIVEVSVGGEYEKPGKTEDIAKSGATLRGHPTYDFAGNRPDPLTVRKHKYLQELGKVSGPSERSGELAKLIADIRKRHQPQFRPQPVRRVTSQQGQHEVQGRRHAAHTGRIACTSIAAVALQRILANPRGANQLRAQDLHNIMREGTDVDRDLRDAPPQQAQAAPSTSEKDGPDPVVTARDDASTGGGSAKRKREPEKKASPVKKSKVEAPAKTTKGKAPVKKKASTSAKASKEDAAPDKGKKKASSKEVEDRYFAHDEVQGQFPGLQVHQQALDNAGPQYLYGVRGDYRRIARQLTTSGPGTGLLVTIGGATIAVANISQGQTTTLALFDSHGQAILETYNSEEGLTDAIEALYPPLPGVDELNASWQATPYRRPVQQ